MVGYACLFEWTSTLQLLATKLLLTYAAKPVILSGANDDIVALHEDSDDQLPSFTCVAAGLPAPILTWAYIPNLDRDHEISLSDGDSYQILSNDSEKDDGRQVTTSSVTFLKLTVTDGGLVRCTARSTTTTTSADALLTVIGT